MAVYSAEQIGSLLQSGQAKTVTEAKQILTSQGAPSVSVVSTPVQPALQPQPTPPEAPAVIITPVSKTGEKQYQESKMFIQTPTGEYRPVAPEISEALGGILPTIPSEAKNIRITPTEVSYTKILTQEQIKSEAERWLREPVTVSEAMGLGKQYSEKILAEGQTGKIVEVPAISEIRKVGYTITPEGFEKKYELKVADTSKIYSEFVERNPLVKAGIIAAKLPEIISVGATSIGAGIGTEIRHLLGFAEPWEKHGLEAMHSLGEPYWETTKVQAAKQPESFLISSGIGWGSLFLGLGATKVAGAVSKIPSIGGRVTMLPNWAGGAATVGIGGAITGISGLFTAPHWEGAVRGEPLEQLAVGGGIMGMALGGIAIGKGIQQLWQYAHPKYDVTYTKGFGAEKVKKVEFYKEPRGRADYKVFDKQQETGFLKVRTEDYNRLINNPPDYLFEKTTTYGEVTGKMQTGQEFTFDKFIRTETTKPEIPPEITFYGKVGRAKFTLEGENVLGFGTGAGAGFKTVKTYEPPKPSMGGLMTAEVLGGKEFQFLTVPITATTVRVATSLFVPPITITLTAAQGDKEIIGITKEVMPKTTGKISYKPQTIQNLIFESPKAEVIYKPSSEAKIIGVPLLPSIATEEAIKTETTKPTQRRVIRLPLMVEFSRIGTLRRKEELEAQVIGMKQKAKREIEAKQKVIHLKGLTTGRVMGLPLAEDVASAIVQNKKTLQLQKIDLNKVVGLMPPTTTKVTKRPTVPFDLVGFPRFREFGGKPRREERGTYYYEKLHPGDVTRLIAPAPKGRGKSKGFLDDFIV